MFRILIAEDDPSTARLLCAIVKRAGYEPLIAADGVQALELLDHNQIDLLLCDVMMPRMDGFTLTRTIRESGSMLPILMLPPKEFNLLYKLLAYPERTFTRLELLDEIWGMDSESDDKTVNVHINRLRTRFYDWPEFEIQTIRGIGYRAIKKV